MSSIEVVPLISNGLSLIVLLALAYLAIPVLLKVLRTILTDFDVEDSTVTLLVQYCSITLWLGIVMIALGRLTSAIPAIQGVIRLIDPTLGGLASVLDLFKFAFIAVCVLLVGKQVKRQG